MKFLPAVCLLLLAAPLRAAEPPQISFEADAVVATGTSPKGQTVWFSVAREISRQSTKIVPHYEIGSDDDGDGMVRLELGKEVPLRSIWFAVDLATGETSVATPPDFPLLEVDLPGKAIPAALNRLELQHRFAYLLLVRPGVGAWLLRAGDGGESDEDGEPDGTLRAALSSLTPIEEGGPPPPERFSPKDVLLIIDPERMESASVRIGG
jgi:hypothetical protein